MLCNISWKELSALLFLWIILKCLDTEYPLILWPDGLLQYFFFHRLGEVPIELFPKTTLSESWLSISRLFVSFASVPVGNVLFFIWDHSFSIYAKLSEKLTFLTPWYTKYCARKRLCSSTLKRNELKVCVFLKVNNLACFANS